MLYSEYYDWKIMDGYRKASVKRILFRDYASFCLFLVSLISLAGVLSIPLLLISIPLLIRRVGRIRNAVEEGMVVSGTVVKTDSSSSTRTYWYTYQVQGETHRTKNWSMFYSPSFQLNDTIDIAYSIESPSWAFPLLLYAADVPSC